MSKANYIAEIEATVCGMPCIIGVIEYSSVAGDSRADSDWDYNGYTDCDWEILDRKGYRANWLAKKMTVKDELAVEEAITNHMENEYEH
jgi:hypothetical protein